MWRLLWFAYLSSLLLEFNALRLATVIIGGVVLLAHPPSIVYFARKGRTRPVADVERSEHPG